MKKNKKDIWIVNNESIRCGNGALYHFLSIPHFGIRIGNIVLIDILCPTTKKLKDIKENTAYLLTVDNLKRKQGGHLSDAKFYSRVHYHVDGKGCLTYFAIPLHWMKKKENER